MCDPVSMTVMAVAALGSTAYSGYQAKKQADEAKREAEKQATEADKQFKAQEAILKSRKSNVKYERQADFTLGDTGGNQDATTSVNGIDAFKIAPTAPFGSALNIPGGVA